MPRIPPLDNDAALPEARAAAEAHVRNHARMTNMKRTLLHSLPAFRALMEWYPLRDTVQPFLGERLTTLFAHAISAETDCLICSTFFRRMLIQTGDNPDRLKLDQRETAVMAVSSRTSPLKPRHSLPSSAHAAASESSSLGDPIV